MKTLIVLFILGYFIYKISQFLLPFFIFKKKNNEKVKRADFHRKVSSMDIQDAEYEDK